MKIFPHITCDCITITSPQTYITNSLTVGAECTNLEQIDPASCQKMPKIQITFSNAIFHPATRRRGNVETSQVRLKWNTRRGLDGTSPDISVVRFHDVLLESCDVSRGSNNVVPSVRLHIVSNKSQMKHSVTSQWYVTKTSQW